MLSKTTQHKDLHLKKAAIAKQDFLNSLANLELYRTMLSFLEHMDERQITILTEEYKPDA